MREDPECFLQNRHVVPDGPSASKIHVQEKENDVVRSDPQEIHTLGKETQTMNPLVSLSCRQVEDIGIKTPVIVLEKRKPEIRVLQSELFANKMMPLPKSIVHITGRSMSTRYVDPLPFMREDLDHLREVELIPVSEKNQGVNNFRVLSRNISQKEEVEQECDVAMQETLNEEYIEPGDNSKAECDVTMQETVSEEYIEPNDDSMEEIGKAEIEMKFPVVPFLTFENQAGLKIER